VPQGASARLPQDLGATGVGRAPEDEEQIGQAVQIHGDEGAGVLHAKDRPLRSPADGPREIEAGGQLAPTGQHERLERLEGRVGRIAFGLEALDELLRDPEPTAAAHRRRGEIGTEVEELVLNPAQGLGRALDGERPAEERVELVDLAHRLDPRVGLRDAAPVAEARLARIAAAGVDPCQPDRLVAFAAHVASPVRARAR
jgi:hypothetical protein